MVTAVAPGAGSPTGTITWLDGNTVLGTAAVAPPAGPLSRPASRPRAATRSPPSTAVTATSSAVRRPSRSRWAAPALAPTTTALAASAKVVRKGQRVEFTATVRTTPGAGTPTGTVRFLAGHVVRRVQLNAAGQASFTLRFAARGRFLIRADYSGDSNFAASAQSITERVTALGSPLARLQRHPAVGG